MPDWVRFQCDRGAAKILPCNTWERVIESNGVIHGKPSPENPCITWKRN